MSCLIPSVTSLHASHEPQIHSSKDVLTRVKELVSDPLSQSFARENGLTIQNVSWEDAARYKGSCWGPNISDMTLQVQDQRGNNHRLPVIRKENFFDTTSDASLDNFTVMVGNETEDGKTATISLKEYLQNISQYITNGKINGSLLAERDEKGIIHSVQTCFLPAETGEVEFNVALFNYQSYAKNPAVLAIVVSSKGTSAQIIDGGREGQKLYFNKAGKQCNYLAERLKEVRESQGRSLEGPLTEEEIERKKLLIIQIPLRVKTVRFCVGDSVDGIDGYCTARGAGKPRGLKGLDDAQIRIGAEKGEFVGLGGLSIERDPNYPIRVTTQFYKITDEAVITRQDMEILAKQMQGEEMRLAIPGSKSSLVLENTSRPTEWIKS